MAYYSEKYKLKKLEELKKHERFMPFVENYKREREEWGGVVINDIEAFMMKHFEAIVDNFEMLEFLNNSDEETINRVALAALKDLDKTFN